MCQETSQGCGDSQAKFGSCCGSPVHFGSKKRIEHLQKVLECLQEKEKDVMEALEELKAKQQETDHDLEQDQM